MFVDRGVICFLRSILVNCGEAMTGSLLITFREGLEAFLVVGIILSYLGRTGLTKYNKWVYVGVSLGIVTAFVLAFLFQIFLSGFTSEISQLYLKIVIMAFAVVILSYMVIWMSKNSRQIKGSVEKKLDEVVTTGSVLALIFMAYLAVLREGFETVLFLGALYGNEMGSGVLYGGLLGLFLAFAVVYALFTGLRRLPVRQFFKLTGALVLLIAAGLLTNMVGIMQDINILPMMGGTLFDISWIMPDSSDVGVFFKALFGYTSAPSLLQALAYIGYLITTSLFLIRGNVSERAHAGA